MAFVVESFPGALSPDFLDSKVAEISLTGVINCDCVSGAVDEIVDAVNQGAIFIFIVIHSKGGDHDEALRLIEVMERAKRFCAVATIIQGKAWSAAAPIFCAGSEGFRFVAPNGSFMIHQARVRDSAQTTSSAEAHVERVQQRVEDIICQASHDPDAFLQLMRANADDDWFLTPDELIEYGLANHKGVPTFVHHFTYSPYLALSNGKAMLM